MDLESINTHLAAGRYYGRSSTCGTKVIFTSEQHAYEVIAKMKNPRHELEPYPCYFCSDLDNRIYNWHNGRKMEEWEWNVFYNHSSKLIEMEDVVLQGGETVRVHNRKYCVGSNCSVHNRSDHHMLYWPQHWRSDAGKMEVICPHGTGHPDPDDVTFQASIGKNVSIHGCDGCCNEMYYYRLGESLPSEDYIG